MSFAGRLADIAHKTVVTTCLGLFTFQAYQLGTQMLIGTDEEKKKQYVQRVHLHGFSPKKKDDGVYPPLLVLFAVA